MSDASPISQFPLIWRWTSANHALFSDVDLAGLKPCSPAEAARIHDDSSALDGPHGLCAESFRRIHTSFAYCSVAEYCAWLRSLSPDLSQRVIVSWDRATALQTTWEFFTAHWDDFCYPSSDTIQIVFGAGNMARQAMDRKPTAATEEYTRGYLEGALQAQARLHLYNGSLLIAGWAVTILCLVCRAKGDGRSAGVGTTTDGKRGGE